MFRKIFCYLIISIVFAVCGISAQNQPVNPRPRNQQPRDQIQGEPRQRPPRNQESMKEFLEKMKETRKINSILSKTKDINELLKYTKDENEIIRTRAVYYVIKRAEEQNSVPAIMPSIISIYHDDTSKTVRDMARKGLEYLRSSDIFMDELEKSKKREIKHAAIKSLQAIKNSEAENTLIKNLNNADPEIKLNCAIALAINGKSESVPILLEELPKKKGMLAAEIIKALGASKNILAVKKLEEILASEEENDKIAGIKALGESGPIAGTAVPALINVFKISIAKEAAKTETRKKSEIDRMLERMNRMNDRRRERLTEQQQEEANKIFESFKEMLKDAEWEMNPEQKAIMNTVIKINDETSLYNIYMFLRNSQGLKNRVITASVNYSLDEEPNECIGYLAKNIISDLIAEKDDKNLKSVIDSILIPLAKDKNIKYPALADILADIYKNSDNDDRNKRVTLISSIISYLGYLDEKSCVNVLIDAKSKQIFSSKAYLALGTLAKEGNKKALQTLLDDVQKDIQSTSSDQSIYDALVISKDKNAVKTVIDTAKNGQSSEKKICAIAAIGNYYEDSDSFDILFDALVSDKSDDIKKEAAKYMVMPSRLADNLHVLASKLGSLSAEESDSIIAILLDKAIYSVDMQQIVMGLFMRNSSENKQLEEFERMQLTKESGEKLLKSAMALLNSRNSVTNRISLIALAGCLSISSEDWKRIQSVLRTSIPGMMRNMGRMMRDATSPTGDNVEGQGFSPMTMIRDMRGRLGRDENSFSENEMGIVADLIVDLALNSDNKTKNDAVYALCKKLNEIFTLNDNAVDIILSAFQKTGEKKVKLAAMTSFSAINPGFFMFEEENSKRPEAILEALQKEIKNTDEEIKTAAENAVKRYEAALKQSEEIRKMMNNIR